MKRGYILLETMIGGALVAGALLLAFDQVGAAKTRSIQMARDMTAHDIALREMEDVRARGFASGILVTTASCPSTPGPSTTTLTGNFVDVKALNESSRKLTSLQGTYKMRLVSQCFREEVTTVPGAPLSLLYKQVTVEVQYVAREGNSGTSTVRAGTRVYERF